MEEQNRPSRPATRSRLRRWWKIPAIIVGSLAVLTALLLIGVSMILTPERLTRLVSQYGTEYLVDGRVDVSRVDLTIWSTFPRAELTIDSLRVVNRAIPEEYRTVIAADRITGHINLAALLIGRISVSHAQIDRPCATLWTGADSTLTSLSVLPPSDSEKEKSDGPLALPDIRITHFGIIGDATLRYVSEPDSLDASVVIRRTSLDGRDEEPQYTLNFDADVNHKPSNLSLAFAMDGGIGWKPSEPLAVSLHDFNLSIDKIRTRTSLRADMADGIRIDELKFELLPLRLEELTALTESLSSLLPALKAVPTVTSPLAAIRLEVTLLKPYVYNPDSLLMPAIHAEAKINDAPLEIPDWYLRLSNLGLDLKADISDAGLDRSTVSLKRLNVEFPATNFTLHAEATNLQTDPAAKGCFKGNVSFTNLNPRLWTLIGMKLRGAMKADVDFDLNLSDLSPQNFHRSHFTGEADFHDFEALMPADTIAAGITRGRLTLGSSGTFRGVDSLLTATVRLDSAWASLPELTVGMKDFDLGVGVSNTSNTADTTTITPMGGRLSIKSLRYMSAADSTRALIRDLAGGVSLTRYKGESRTPQFGARVAARRIVYADGPNRASLRGIDIAATAHKSIRRQRTPRPFSHADSARFAARRDSLLLAESKYERLDFNVDRSMVSLLRRWNIRGHILAKGGRVITPLFPLRTRLKNLNVTFNADSLMLHSMAVSAGRSDFSLTGSVTNIQRALSRRVASRPLKLRLTVSSDSLNINQLTQAAFRGAAYAAKADSLTAAAAGSALEADDATLEAAADAAAVEEMMAIVVPMNIDAKIDVTAQNITYTNLALKDFRGEVLVANGAANLRNLHAATDIGSVDLNMLYYAPTRSDVNFGLGLDLRRFNIGRVTELMPTLDSIMPILNTLGGIIDVDISATTPVDSTLNIMMPQLRAMIHLSGDSLRVLDEKTFKTVSKWLLFHDKKKNMIDHMDVHLTVDDNQMSLYPFMFDFDRYRIGVMGNNDMNLNLNYHVSILKSPVPFKFGINIKGSADKMKIRLGRARFKENMAAETVKLSDTIRVNLAREIRDVFARGAKAARLGPLDIKRPRTETDITETADTISAADSLYFIQQGLIEPPAAPADSLTIKPDR